MGWTALPPVSCSERPIIDGVRTPVAYSITVHDAKSVSGPGNKVIIDAGRPIISS